MGDRRTWMGVRLAVAMALGMQRVAHGLGNGDDLCSPECTRAMINDGRCDMACVTRACMWDGKDCECAPGCLATWLGDGECDAQCNNAVCDFDAGDCSEATVLPTAECSLGCLPSQLGDGTCHAPCNVARCQWDLGDCPLTRPAWPSSAVGGLTAGQQAGASRARDTVRLRHGEARFEARLAPHKGGSPACTARRVYDARVRPRASSPSRPRHRKGEPNRRDAAGKRRRACRHLGCRFLRLPRRHQGVQSHARRPLAAESRAARGQLWGHGIFPRL